MLCHRIYARLEPNSRRALTTPGCATRPSPPTGWTTSTRRSTAPCSRNTCRYMCHIIVGMDPTRAVWPEGLSEIARDFEKKSAEIYKVSRKCQFFDEKEHKIKKFYAVSLKISKKRNLRIPQLGFKIRPRIFKIRRFCGKPQSLVTLVTRDRIRNAKVYIWFFHKADWNYNVDITDDNAAASSQAR